MKRFIYGILILSVSILAESQEYTPFDFDNGEWYCYFSTKGGLFGGGHDTYYATDSVKFFCSGDTLINDTLYKKLYYAGNTSSQIVPKTSVYGYYGAIRNDTANKQVWYYAGDHNFLIYDFNLINGDSLCNTTEGLLPVTFYFCGKVTSFDSVNYCNKYFRRYNIGGQSIIEGIGSDKGLFPVLSSPWFSELICYSEKNDSECESCKINFTNSFDHIIKENTFNINQTNNQLHIFSDYIIESVELFDLSGRRIISNHHLKSNSTDIYIPQKGIYILSIKIDDKIVERKIIIQ